MTKQEAAAYLLVRRPGLASAYVTSDAQAFEQYDLAQLHARSLVDQTIYTYVPGNLVSEMRVADAELGRSINRTLAVEAYQEITQDAAAVEAEETLNGNIKGLGDTLRASELSGFDDPVLLTTGVEVDLDWVVVGAYRRSGLTLEAWQALSAQDLEDAVQAHIDLISDGE